MDEESNSKEDLSYLIKTYRRYDSNNNIYKEIWTYDGYKETGGRYYVNSQLSAEYKNYFYGGLYASWDYYSYQDNEVTLHEHVECEYLDETFRRVKHQKEEYFFPDTQNNYTSEIYRKFDGKKCVGFKRYQDGILTAEGHDFNYDGLHCTSITTKYSSPVPNVAREETSFSTVYLDDTYLRTKSTTRTNVRFYDDGTSDTITRYTVNHYEDKKPIGLKVFENGKLAYVARDYQYNGLTCHYFYDTYRNGEVVFTQMYEVEYLE